jgi:hypothetical protein
MSTRQHIGPLPPAGQWVRLEVPAILVGLEGRVLNGMAFTLWDGRATWERAGRISRAPMDPSAADRLAPVLFFDGGAVQSYSPLALALETLVEREGVLADKVPSRWAAETGLHFLRLLDVEGMGAHRSLFVKGPYALKPPTPKERQALDGDSRRFLDVVAGRAIDGVRLQARLAALRRRNALAELFQEAPFDSIAAADHPKVLQAVNAWLTWYETPVSESDGRSAWVPERIEYEFAVSGRTSEGEVVLAAPEYLEGYLDWFSFVGRPGTSLGGAQGASTISRAFIPAPVSYRGMPSPRFWEFEDANVNFAKVEGNPEDLARLLLVKFALEYGNDWFLVPLEMDVGSLCRVRSLIVANTFGERMLIPHTTQVDGESSPWRAFALSNDSQRLFFLPPGCSAPACRARPSRRCCSCATRWQTSPGRSSAWCKALQDLRSTASKHSRRRGVGRKPKRGQPRAGRRRASPTGSERPCRTTGSPCSRCSRAPRSG